MNKGHIFALKTLELEEKMYTENLAVGLPLFNDNQKLRELLDCLYAIKNELCNVIYSPEINGVDLTKALEVIKEYEELEKSI